MLSPERARKPLLLLDVDGVCCPFGAGEGAAAVPGAV
jgi:hypothetical protein